ncbi:hypothetical protein Mgra_00008565 [Meloidogyne graminicola]|uniref:Uncharacterized protein n=1 Tax=Meloidogyne graminicola TaxID=189291 RepID=A0A8S9ZFC0_9BILA|nr:hypothetical protein Mgra_00008565 [Meloidogyne graminicola]
MIKKLSSLQKDTIQKIWNKFLRYLFFKIFQCDMNINCFILFQTFIDCPVKIENVRNNALFKPKTSLTLQQNVFH